MPLRHVLVVVHEGSPQGTQFCETLDRVGVSAIYAASTGKALGILAHSRAQLVAVEIGIKMPGSAELICELKAMGLPVVGLASHYDGLALMRANAAGMDDYLTSIPAPEALLERLDALLEPEAPMAADVGTALVAAGDVRVDLLCRRAFVGEVPLQVSPAEFGLLAMLLRRAGRACSDADLAREALGLNLESGEAARVVKHHVYRLRAKLRVAHAPSDLIATVRGFGYRCDQPAAEGGDGEECAPDLHAMPRLHRAATV